MARKVRIAVIATKKGFSGGNFYKPGDEFFIYDEKHFSKRWMKHSLNQTPAAKKAILNGNKQLLGT